MEAFLVATGIVALAEIGDKTQLLAFILAARYKQPLPIIAGILVATLANHAIAGGFGFVTAVLLSPSLLRWLVAGSCFAMALWILIPDKLDQADARLPHAGVFIATVVFFFIAEMGDKTQVATVVLAARYQELVLVVIGTTLGMMIANVPVVLFGEHVSNRLPVRPVRFIAAGIMSAIGIATLLGIGEGLGF